MHAPHSLVQMSEHKFVVNKTTNNRTNGVMTTRSTSFMLRSAYSGVCVYSHRMHATHGMAVGLVTPCEFVCECVSILPVNLNCMRSSSASLCHTHHVHMRDTLTYAAHTAWQFIIRIHNSPHSRRQMNERERVPVQKCSIIPISLLWHSCLYLSVVNSRACMNVAFRMKPRMAATYRQCNCLHAQCFCVTHEICTVA